MRIITIFLFHSFLLPIVGCRGCLNRISEEIILPDQNPELINYLQGNWALTNDGKFIFRIKRDSLITIYNDSIRSANSLHYLFDGAASRYFTKDTSFDFYSANGLDLSTNDFKLVEVDKNSNDTILHILAYVSKSRIDMNSTGKFISLSRIK
jgi:hypothetical protein